MARRSSHSRLKAEINIVPYIDVMLVLLVIFMVTAPLLNQGVEVDLPKAPAESLNNHEKATEVLVLSIQKDGSCYLGIGAEKAQTVNCDTLEPRHQDSVNLMAQKPQPPVLVRADREVQYDQVIKGMAALRNTGAVRVGLSTAPPEASTAKQ